MLSKFGAYLPVPSPFCFPFGLQDDYSLSMSPPSSGSTSSSSPALNVIIGYTGQFMLAPAAFFASAHTPWGS